MNIHKLEIYSPRLFNRLNRLTQKKEMHMKYIRQLAKTALALGFALGLSGKVHAVVSTDTITITITPNAYYAVAIATGNVSMNLGTVNLGASTQTVAPATITIQSTFATTDLRIRGVISSGGTPWTFDANTASQESDALAAWVTFTNIARTTAPAQTADYFSGTVPGANSSDVLDATERMVGTAGAVTNLFVNGSDFDPKVMDGLAPNAQADMWLYFRLPSASTTNNAQNVTIYLTALTPVP